MADQFQIIPYKVRSAGTDVPPEEVQAAINSLAQQTTVALNSVASDPTGPAGGDLSGTYPNPTVAKVHATSGTLDGVVITGSTLNSTPVGQAVPNSGAFTTLTATTPVGVASGGTGQNTLSAHNVLLGEGTGGVGFAAPGASGQILASSGAAVDPSFQTKTALAIASSGANTDITSLNAPALGAATATTAAAHTNTTQVATTAFVETEFASPPVAGIGSVTPAPGAFTTLTATTPVGVASGGTGRNTLTIHGVLIGETTGAINQTAAGTTGQMLLGVTGADPAFGNNPTITGGTIDNAVIGGTTKAAGSFTTVVATGTITPSTTNGIVGTTAADSANAGSVGEFASSAQGPSGLTTATPLNASAVTLTAGDWDVWGVVQFNASGGASPTDFQSGISTTSATFAGYANNHIVSAAFSANFQGVIPTPVVRINVSSTTTAYLVAQANFSSGTMTANGTINARRVR